MPRLKFGFSAFGTAVVLAVCAAGTAQLAAGCSSKVTPPNLPAPEYEAPRPYDPPAAPSGAAADPLSDPTLGIDDTPLPPLSVPSAAPAGSATPLPR